jgi:hypothetical protein
MTRGTALGSIVLVLVLEAASGGGAGTCQLSQGGTIELTF